MVAAPVALAAGVYSLSRALAAEARGEAARAEAARAEAETRAAKAKAEAATAEAARAEAVALAEAAKAEARGEADSAAKARAEAEARAVAALAKAAKAEAARVEAEARLTAALAKAARMKGKVAQIEEAARQVGEGVERANAQVADALAAARAEAARADAEARAEAAKAEAARVEAEARGEAARAEAEARAEAARGEAARAEAARGKAEARAEAARAETARMKGKVAQIEEAVRQVGEGVERANAQVADALAAARAEVAPMVEAARHTKAAKEAAEKHAMRVAELARLAPERARRAKEAERASAEREAAAETRARQKRADVVGAAQRSAQDAAVSVESAKKYIKEHSCVLAHARLTGARYVLYVHKYRGKVPALERNAAGAVLYRGTEYVGLAVAVVEGETHATRVAYRGGHSEHDGYELVTATERDRAAAADAAGPALSEAFVEAMFLDDVCVQKGNTGADSVRCFQLCAERAKTGVRLEIPGAHGTIERDEARWEKFGECVERVLAEIGGRGGPAVGAYVVPVGYYDETRREGHQCAFLVRFDGASALIAMADTGETAVAAATAATAATAETVAVVVFRVASLDEARRKLELLARIHQNGRLLTCADDIRTLRALVIGAPSKCTTTTTGQKRASEEGAGDAHSAVRALDVGDAGLLSHPQRGGSCAYYSVFWALGVARALETGAIGVRGAEVEVSVAGAWGQIAALDRELKVAALPLVRAFPRLAQVVAALYSRCEWLDVAALRTPVEARPSATKLELACSVQTGTVAVPDGALDASVALTTLRDVAAWVDGVLVLAEVDDSREALLVVLAHKARGVLIAPMERYEPAAKDDHESVVRVAHFLCYLRGKSRDAVPYAASLACGMLARCARLAVQIAAASELNAPQAELDEDYVANGRATVTTCLPWAAAEYCALLRDARDVHSLLYASQSPYTRIQAEGDAKGTILDEEREAGFWIRSVNRAVAVERGEAWARVFPTLLELAPGRVIGEVVSNARYADAAERVRGAVRARFGFCPDEFERMTIKELSAAVRKHLRTNAPAFLLEILKAREGHAADPDRALLALLWASSVEDLVGVTKETSLMSEDAKAFMVGKLGGRYDDARRELAAREVDADRAMLLAIPRAIELGRMTHAHRVNFLARLEEENNYDATMVLHVRACLALQLASCTRGTNYDTRILQFYDERVLAETQLRALRYLCRDPRVAALNVTMNLLNLAYEAQSSPDLALEAPGRCSYMIGHHEGGVMMCVVGPSGAVRDGPSLPLLARRTPPSAPYAEMLRNTEGLGGSGAPAWLEISLSASRPALAHDVDELVRWAEFADAPEGRSDAQAVRSCTMPLSARGATASGVAELAARASKWTKGPLRALLVDGRLDSMAHVRKGGAELALAYVTVAVLKGRAEELVGCALASLDGPTVTTEIPYVRWAPRATRARLAALAPGREHGLPRLDKGGTLVFRAEGGAVGRLHARLDGAGCAFDHWNDGASEIVLERGVTVRGTDAALELALPKEGSLAVFVGDTEYWDPTVGAGVVPIGTERVERLVVVPGTRGSARVHARFVTCEWVVSGRADPSRAAETIEHFARPRGGDAFVVELDAACLLPAASTPTAELLALFVAYAYAGSVCGTRLIPLVASRAVGDADAGMIARALYGAPCPLSFYAVCAASYGAFRDLRGELARMLRCAPEAAARELRARMLWADEPAEFVEGLEAAELRVRHRALAPTVRYGDCERDFVRARLAEKATNGNDAKARELHAACAASYFHADPWKTALEASTGKFVRDDQRARIAELVEGPWAVVQMQMGFGKSSVIAPMLVARYLSRTEVRVVLVTQPAHLVPQALRTVGALVASGPSLEPAYVLGAAELRTVERESWADAKLVVVLSTADLQRAVRDNPRLFYENSAAIAHVADEVDEESDPLKCEVIVEGAETAPHYDPAVAANVGVYYRAALELEGPATRADGPATRALARVSPRSALRLAAAHRAVETLVHKVHYGMSADPSVYIAVPYVCASKPSTVATFSDIDVAISLLVRALKRRMRASDVELVKRDIIAKFGSETGARILAALDPTGRMAYYATQIAMPRLRVSKTETSVSFVDLLGIAATFVGFSGTMGASVRVPAYDRGDAREVYGKQAPGGSVPVHSDAESNAAVGALIGERPAQTVLGAPSKERAELVLGWIAAEAGRLSVPVLVVDGSGEFGSFDDDLAAVEGAFGGEVGHFDERGQLVGKERRVRYYRHRDARGVDSEMGDDTVGFVVIASRTRLSDAAQAVYRLRRLAHGQTVRIVLASEGAIELPLVDLLLANEQEHAEAAEPALREQLAHAAIPKVDAGSFERRVATYDAEAGVGRTSERQQTREKVAAATGDPSRSSCFAADDLPAEHATFRNRAVTEISADLEALRVGLSPFLTFRGWTDAPNTRHRAFAVVEDGAPRLVVMALAEVWTRFRGDATPYAAYASDGRKLRGSSDAPRNLLLLGRYLCDGALSLLEEYELLAFLRRTYASDAERGALRNVVSCLWESRFLIQPTKLLHRLAEGFDAGARKTAADVLEHVRSEMFGGSEALDAVLGLYVAAIAASAAFGTRRFV
jgi:hypothetical protein